MEKSNHNSTPDIWMQLVHELIMPSYVQMTAYVYEYLPIKNINIQRKKKQDFISKKTVLVLSNHLKVKISK